MILLFYQPFVRTRYSTYDLLRIDELELIQSKDFQISFDRDLLPVADAVVFSLPHLHRFLEDDIIKPKNQLWVAWSLESYENYPWMRSEEIKELFDIWMTYHLDADVSTPYFNSYYGEKLRTETIRKEKNVCMFISSYANKSHRIEYLTELMNYIDIDSYGFWHKNKQIENDEGYTTKLEIIKKYKFSIAFENSIENDYVTEKFFEPLIVGSVPIYLGAPNIDEFSPGKNSFVDVRNFETPSELADYIGKCCKDESSYNTFLEWKLKPFNASFEKLLEDQKDHPFLRLANLISKNEQPRGKPRGI